MPNYSKLLLEFINSFDSGELKTPLNEGFSAIFEYRMSGTASDMYSDGVKIPKVETPFDTTDDDDGPNDYLGSDQEQFGSDNTDLVEELKLFDIEHVTMHDSDNNQLIDKFHGTNAYQTLVPQIKALVDNNKLYQSHMNQSDGGVKILKA